MANTTHLRKWIAGAALGAVIGTSILGPVPLAGAATNPFTDVASGHWAEKHLTKLYLQGIVSGKGQGIFDPSGSIRREDAVIVALKFMGVDDEINKAGPFTFPGTFGIDDYAKPYLTEAFKRKLLIPEEEYALANAEKGKHWGQSPASREWVARLLVRAIGLQAEAEGNAGKATSFSDDGKIDSIYKSYVLTAVQQGLVTGVTTTTFEPKASINRASIATLFSKAESKVSVAYSGQVSGMLMSIEPDKLTVLHDDGSVHFYTLSSNTLFARYDSDKPTKFGDLKLYGKAVLISGSNGSIGYVEQTDDKPYVTTVEGTFSKITADNSKIWLSVSSGFESHDYDKSMEPVVTDASGKPVALSSIPENAVVTLTKDAIRANPKVISITVKTTVVNKSGSGTVAAWNAASGALKVQDASGVSEDLAVSPQATFLLGDIPVKGDQLKVGDSISYEVKNSVIVSVQITKPPVTTATGKFLSVNKAERTIQYTENGQLKAKFYNAAATVSIDGLADAGFDDLQKDDNVTLTFDDKGDVSQIAVSGRSVQTLIGATIEGYIAKTKTLSLTDADGNIHNLILGPNVRYDSNGTKVEAATALTQLTAGKKVTIGFSGSNAVSVALVVKYSGTVTEHNLTSKTLKIKVDSGTTVTVPYASPTIEIYGVTTPTASDLKAGDQVTVLLSGASDQASTIQVQKTAQFEVVSADTAGAKLRLKKAGSSTTEEFNIPAAAVLQNESGAGVTLGYYGTGSFVNLTFVGKTVVKAKSVGVTYGRVVSVNASTSTVDLALPNGTTVTKAAGASPLVQRDNVSSSSLASVSVNDRVEIRLDENERTVIFVVPAQNRLFWKYDSVSKYIDMQRSGTEAYSFALDPQTYIHQGTTTLAPTDLKFDDKLALYVLRGKLVEVSRS